MTDRVFSETVVSKRTILIHHKETREFYVEKEIVSEREQDNAQNDIIYYRISKGGVSIVMNQDEFSDLAEAIYQISPPNN